MNPNDKLCGECDRPADHLPMYRGAGMRRHSGYPRAPRRESEWVRRARESRLPAKELLS